MLRKQFKTIPYHNKKLEKGCITVIDHEKHDFNAKLIIVDVNITTEPRKSSLITIRFNILAEQVDQLMLYVKIGIIDDNNGMKYKKEFIRTAIDIPKLLKGGGILSFIGKTVLSGLAEAADFELKFPLKRVLTFKASLKLTKSFL